MSRFLLVLVFAVLACRFDTGGTGTGDVSDANSLDAPPSGPDAVVKPVVINEFLANNPGPDDREFVEIFGPANTNFNGLRVITVDGDSGNVGIINAVLEMGVTNPDGFFTVNPGDLGIQNGTETLLLVQGFVGGVFDDIDTNNDGEIDNLTGTIIDAVATVDSDGGETYAGTSVLPVGHPPQTGQVVGAARSPDGMDTDLPGDWIPIDASGTTPGFAQTTPGSPNIVNP